MTNALDDILNSPDVGLPEHVHPVCVAGKLNVEFERIDEELDRLLTAEQDNKRASKDGEGKPGRLGQRPRDPRIAELNAEREALRERMAKHTVHLLVRARPEHVWAHWKAENPPQDGVKLDQRVGFDVDALTDAIRTKPRDYVVSINDQAYTDEQWAKIMAAAAPGDIWRLTQVVYGLHERAVDVPKSLSGLLGIISLDAASS